LHQRSFGCHAVSWRTRDGAHRLDGARYYACSRGGPDDHRATATRFPLFITAQTLPTQYLFSLGGRAIPMLR
jgi:hypothetical protein